jgi:polar amino acid transport system permease protein
VGYAFQFGAVWTYTDLIVEGAIETLRLSAITMAAGLLIGIIGAMMRTGRIVPLRWLATLYVEAIRNTPLLIQLFLVFLGLPSAGLRFTAGQAAVIALSINLGAYATEIVRAGIESVRRNQIEAGLALGMSGLQVFRYVVLFQALKAIYPALASQFVLLLLATSLVSQIGADELFHVGGFIDSRTFRSFEVYTVVTAAYLVMAVGFRALFAVIYLLVFDRRSWARA